MNSAEASPPEQPPDRPQSAASSAVTAPASNGPLARLAPIAFVLALFVTVAIHLWQAPLPYLYKSGPASADVSVMARSFAREGIAPLHAVPINNNPPVNRQTDSYIHWPPLLPIVLSCAFRVFGESETVAHTLILILLLLSTFLLYRIAYILMGTYGAALTGFFWLTLPVIVNRGQVVIQQALVVLFILGAIFCWLKSRRDADATIGTAWIAMGALSAALGVLSSWEAVLLIPGLWFAALGNSSDRRRALLYTAAISVSLVALVAVYAFGQPELFTDTLQTVKFRMGLSSTYSHHAVYHSAAKPVGFWLGILFEIFQHVLMLGILGFTALLWLVRGGLKRLPGTSADSRVVLYGLASPWIIWYALMREHGASIDFEVIIAAPLAALAMAALVVSLRPPRRLVEWALAVVIVCWIGWPLAMCARTGYKKEDASIQLIRVAGILQKSTDSNSIILWPTDNVLPLYYSHRHIVRMVVDSSSLEKILPELKANFDHSSIYLAVPPELANKFQGKLTNPLLNTKDVVLVRLSQPGETQPNQR